MRTALDFSIQCPTVVAGGLGDKLENPLVSSQLASLTGFAPEQLSLLPNSDLTLDCFLGSDLELPRDAIFSNIGLALPGRLRVTPRDLFECHVPAKTVQSAAPVSAGKEG